MEKENHRVVPGYYYSLAQKPGIRSVSKHSNLKNPMFKKSPAIIALSIAFLLPVNIYSQKASPSPADKPPQKTAPNAPDYSSLPPDKIIQKLQGQIIIWQDQIIKGMQVQPIEQSLLRDMVGVALDAKTNAVTDQKMLDLLSKYGVGITTKDGKKLTTAGTPLDTNVPVESVPYIEVPKNATPAEKTEIRTLLEKAGGVAEKATLANKLIARLQALVIDLVALGKTDAGAQSLVDKYHIKQNTPSPSPSPAP